MARFLKALLIPCLIVLALNWRVVFTLFSVLLFPHPVVTAKVLTKAETTIPDNSIAYPRLGIAAPLIISSTNPTVVTDWSIIRRDLFHGVSLSDKIPPPGQAGTTIIIGHSSDWTPHQYSAIFAPLGEAQVGDKIIVKYHGQEYAYQVSSTKVINPTDMKTIETTLYQAHQGNQLALVTCWPVFTTAQRLIVFADPVKL